MEWIQLVYRVPPEPTRHRTSVWRQLRGLGAIYLQDGCCVLLHSDEAARAFADIAARVRDAGGEATISLLSPAEAGWEERLVATLNRARDEEYQELIDTAERFEEEVARETRKNKFTFAVLEEIEDDYERLERWRDRVRTRDTFGSSLSASVDARLTEARRTRDTFAEAVHRHEQGIRASGTPDAR